MDNGIIYHYIKTIRIACIKLAWKNYFALLPACINSNIFRADTKFNLYKESYVKESTISRCSSVTSSFVLHMCHTRDYIYENALSGSNLFYNSILHIFMENQL
jgi:hypothetical protein